MPYKNLFPVCLLKIILTYWPVGSLRLILIYYSDVSESTRAIKNPLPLKIFFPVITHMSRVLITMNIAVVQILENICLDYTKLSFHIV